MKLTTYPVYPNAPITEALLDIRCVLPQEISLSNIEPIYEQVNDRFPEKSKRVSMETTLEVPSLETLDEDSPTASFSKKKTDGLMFRSQENAKIFQARLDGFTFNKLKPYENWSSFSSEAQDLWRIYAENLKPISVSRLALRYINRIDIPLPIKDFKEYVLTIPEVAPSLPQGMANFFSQLTIPFPEQLATAVIIETMEFVSNDKLPLIFDIDVFREGNFDPYSGEIWGILENLRTVKNIVFFGSFTDKAKELFL